MKIYECPTCCDTGEVLALPAEGPVYVALCPGISETQPCRFSQARDKGDFWMGAAIDHRVKLRSEVKRFQAQWGQVLEANPPEMAVWAKSQVGEREYPSQLPPDLWPRLERAVADKEPGPMGQGFLLAGKGATLSAMEEAIPSLQEPSWPVEVLALAERRGWPTVAGRKGEIIGEVGWRKFAATAGERALLRALEWLEDYEERKAA